MSQFLLKDSRLIEAATSDIDNRKAANEARNEFAQRLGADGFKVIMSAQQGPKGLDVQAVTLLKFGGNSPQGFFAVGQDADGKVLAVPDVRTERGERLAQEMAALPSYTSKLSRALGFGANVENGKLSYGVSQIEEIGREVVIKTVREPNETPGIERITPEAYADMKASAERATKMARASAPNPYGN